MVFKLWKIERCDDYKNAFSFFFFLSNKRVGFRMVMEHYFSIVLVWDGLGGAMVLTMMVSFLLICSGHYMLYLFSIESGGMVTTHGSVLFGCGVRIVGHCWISFAIIC